VTAADARQLVADLGADNAAGKVVADAPELTNVQRDALRGILLFGNDDGADPAADPIAKSGRNPDDAAS
jgi:hypothetical protein